MILSLRARGLGFSFQSSVKRHRANCGSFDRGAKGKVTHQVAMAELKAENVLIIKTDDNLQTEALLKASFEVEVLQVEDEMHVTLQTDQRSEIAAAIVTAGIGLKELRTKQSSLEDTFWLGPKKRFVSMLTLIKMNGSINQKRSTWIMLLLLVLMTFGLTYVVRLGSPEIGATDLFASLSDMTFLNLFVVIVAASSVAEEFSRGTIVLIDSAFSRSQILAAKPSTRFYLRFRDCCTDQ